LKFKTNFLPGKTILFHKPKNPLPAKHLIGDLKIKEQKKLLFRNCYKKQSGNVRVSRAKTVKIQAGTNAVRFAPPKRNSNPNIIETLLFSTNKTQVKRSPL